MCLMYLQPCETSMMEINDWEPSNIGNFLRSGYRFHACREKQEAALSWEYRYLLVERNDMSLDTARSSSVI